MSSTPGRQVDLGCQPPVLSPQDSDRAARQNRTLRKRAGFRVSPTDRERIRSLWGGTLLDLDFRRSRLCRGARLQGRQEPCDFGDRRRRHVGRYGLRGDEQCRRARHAPDRDPERQRHVHCAAGRRDEQLSVADRQFEVLPVGPSLGQASGRTAAPEACRPRPSGPRSTRVPWSPAARCSRNSASSTSARSTAIIWNT